MEKTELNRSRLVRLTLNYSPVIIALLAVLAAPALAQSQGGAAKTDEWQFTVAPYLILPWMNGTTAVKGYELEVNANPSDIFSNLQFGAMGYFEARKARWAFGVDALYMALGSSIDQPPLNIDVNQGAYTFVGMRQVHENVDVLFGARWNVLQGKLSFKGPLQTVLNDTKQWVDPIVGLRLKQNFRGKWHFSLEGDIGGFGAASKFAWELYPVVGVDVHKRVSLDLGYRVLGMDYDTGSGANYFKYDVITQGIVLGASFHF